MLENIFPGDSELAHRMRALDWSKTDLGSPEEWPAHLRTAVSLCLTSRIPVVMYWGPNFTVLYNDPYISFLGETKHPRYLGRPGRECWSEIWDTIGPMLQSVVDTGKATWSEDLRMFFARRLPLEEVFVRFTFGPLLALDGRTVAGIFCPCTETTEKVLGARRLETLRKLGIKATETLSVAAACQSMARTLEENPYDIPFAGIYLIDPNQESASLVAHAGLDDTELALPPSVSLVAGAASPWPIAAVARTHRGEEIADLRASGIEVAPGPWFDPVTRALLLPITSPGLQSLAGVLVVGVSPRLVLDAAYRTFFDLVAGHIGTAIAEANAYEAERKRAEALTALDQAKTAFFSNVSHEFRTPLTLMLGPIEDLLSPTQTDLPDTAREQLDVVNRNAQRLLRLVNSLLDFSRIQAGRIRALYQPTELGGLTAELSSVFRAAIERAGLRLTVDCPPLAEPVFVDRSMWEKIVLNLLSNAFKYTLEGEIAVTLRRMGDTVQLQVRDTGTGIPAEEMPRLFERFHRIENVRGRTFEGSGIGLALVQDLVKLHGGSARAESVVNRGSTFIITLPLGSTHLPANQISSPRAPDSVAASSASAFLAEALRWLPDSASAADDQTDALFDAGAVSRGEPVVGQERPRVLVADDNADMREYIARILGDSYSVQAVSDGEAALSAARHQPPDVILSDIMMPRLDGLGLLRELRADTRTAHLPVIMLSARAGEESRVEGMEAGADDYLVKPFSARELLARVAGSLKLSRMRGEMNRVTGDDLQAMIRLHEVGERCARAGNRFHECLEAILEAALFVTRTTKGKLQLLEAGAFKIAVQRGFEGPFLDFFATVEAGQGSTSGAAKQAVARAVVEDVEHSPVLAGTEYLKVLLDAGVHAVQSTPLVSSSGKVLGMISTHFSEPHRPSERELHLMDLLARQAADYLERKQTEQLLQDADRRKDEFLATLAHELRNPLAPLNNMMSVMRLKEGDLDLRRKGMEMMDRQLRHIGRLVDDLLDVSRISRGTLELRFARTNLASSLSQALENYRPFIAKAGQELSVSMPAEPIYVNADPIRLAQTFGNLLDNACKYTKSGGRIRVSAELDGADAVVKVTDDGIGIPAEMLHSIFDMFTQLDRSLERSHSGLGIGLTLVKRLIEMHGGSVAAFSDGQDRGARFEIRLPALAASHAPPPVQASPKTVASARKRILVVDDNRDNADSLSLLLKIGGHDSYAIHDGHEAIEAAERLRPDMILLDIAMPKLNGLDVCTRIREMPWGKDMMVVAVTGWGQDADRRKSKEAGFDFHLVKPIVEADIARLLSRLGQ